MPEKNMDHSEYKHTTTASIETNTQTMNNLMYLSARSLISDGN